MTDHRAALQRAMALREIGRDARQQSGEGGLGDIGIGGAGRLAIEPMAQKLNADVEFAVADPAPREIEHLFVMRRTIEHRLEFDNQLAARRRRIEEIGGQHGIEQCRPLGDRLGKTRARAHDLGDEAQNAGVVIKEREERHARRQATEEFVKTHERAVGIGRRAERCDQRRHQLCQQFAGAGAARRAIAAVMPVANDRGDRGWISKAEIAKRLQRLGIVLGAGEDEIAR